MGNGAFGARLRRQQEYNDALATAVGASNTLIGKYRTDTGKYPSNTQIWFAGKDSSDNFSPALLNKVGFGNTPAPKGHFILKAFDRDYGAVSGITAATFTVLRETDATRPSCVEAALGRIFYSGTEDLETQGFLYFSALIGSTGDLERCYQQNDPTSEDFSDLLDTDGGAIQLTNAGKIVALKEFQKGILVFSVAGVWHLRAGDDSGFKATNYIIEKLSDVGCLGRDCVVYAEGDVYFWSDIGIYKVTSDQFGRIVVQSVTSDTIQTFYNNISNIAKKNAIGRYVGRTKQVVWIYKNDDGVVDDDSQRNNILIFDLRLGCFIPHQVADGLNNTIVGIFLGGSFNTERVEDDIVVNGNPVVRGTDQVYVAVIIDSTADTGLKFVNMQYGAFDGGGGDGEPSQYFYGIGFYQMDNPFYLDPNGYYPAFVETNNMALGELMRSKQAQYIYTYFNRTEDGYELDEDENIVLANQSSCFVSGKWEWTDSGALGRWSNPQQAYRLSTTYIPTSVSDSFDYDYSVIKSRLLLRGKGRALRLRFEGEQAKGFELLGWALPITIEATP